jgi:hypothetical protein
MLSRYNRSMQRMLLHWTCFVLIVGIGTFARTWEYRRLPRGLNQDEASIGVAAYRLLVSGTDQFGTTDPVEFAAWGDGQSVLYAYVLIPFIAIAGKLTPLVVRIPMLITGLLTVPLLYLVGRRLHGAGLGLFSMFCIAISPWHIMLSRWALEANLFPFTFLLALLALQLSRDNGLWFAVAAACLGFSLYAYGTSHAVVPLYFLLILLANLATRTIGPRHVILGVIIFLALATPAILFIWINSTGRESIHVGSLTIPRWASAPRQFGLTILTHPSAAFLRGNLGTAASLLFTESDGLAWNVVEPYGTFYRLALIGGVIGAALLMRRIAHRDHVWECSLLLAWLAASTVLAGLLPLNINRFNIVWMPLILCAAIAMNWAGSRFPGAGVLVVVLLLGAFFSFNGAYHGRRNQQEMARTFRAGIVDALRYAAGRGDGPICVVGGREIFIYTMFAEPSNAEFFPAALPVARLGRFRHGVENCPRDPDMIYVAARGAGQPFIREEYRCRRFDTFEVCEPRT